MAEISLAVLMRNQNDFARVSSPVIRTKEIKLKRKAAVAFYWIRLPLLDNLSGFIVSSCYHQKEKKRYLSCTAVL